MATNLIYRCRRSPLSFLAVMLLLLLPAACRPGQPTSSPAEPTPTRRAADRSSATPIPRPTEGLSTPTALPASRLYVDPGKLTGISLQLWHPYGGETGAALSRLVDEFNASNEWGITAAVTAADGPDDLQKRINAALETGQPPDVAAGYLHQALGWDEQRRLADLQPYLEDPDWGYSLEDQADFYPAFWDHAVVDDRRVGLPLLPTAQVLFYNVRWAGDLGFSTAPSTPQELADQACAAAEANNSDDIMENDGTGGLLVTPNYAAALGWIYSFDGGVLRQPEPGVDQSAYRFNTQAAQEAFTFLRDLYDERCAWAVEKNYTEEEFAGRLALVSSGSLTDIPYQTQVMGRLRGDEWTVIPFPSPGESPAVSAYGLSLVVFAGSQERQLAAWLLAKWLLEPANHARLVEVSSSFPLRQSELEHLQEYRSRSPQWAAALALAPQARSEPAYRSWEMVRWALSDAFTQLFRSYFTVDQAPNMLNYLDRTAAELHLGPDADIFKTPEGTATPTGTPRP